MQQVKVEGVVRVSERERRGEASCACACACWSVCVVRWSPRRRRALFDGARPCMAWSHTSGPTALHPWKLGKPKAHHVTCPGPGDAGPRQYQVIAL